MLQYSNSQRMSVFSRQTDIYKGLASASLVTNVSRQDYSCHSGDGERTSILRVELSPAMVQFQDRVRITIQSPSSESERSSIVWEQEGEALLLLAHHDVMVTDGRAQSSEGKVDLHKRSRVARFRPKFNNSSSIKVADKTLKSTQPAYSVDKS